MYLHDSFKTPCACFCTPTGRKTTVGRIYRLGIHIGRGNTMFKTVINVRKGAKLIRLLSACEIGVVYHCMVRRVPFFKISMPSASHCAGAPSNDKVSDEQSPKRMLTDSLVRTCRQLQLITVMCWASVLAIEPSERPPQASKDFRSTLQSTASVLA